MTGRTMNTVQHDPYKDQREAAVPGHPVVDPADWGAEAMATSDAWRIKLNSNDIKNLHAAVQNYTECEGLQLPFEVVRSKMIDTGQVLCMAAVLHKIQRPLTIDRAMQHAVFIPCHNNRCLAYAG